MPDQRQPTDADSGAAWERIFATRMRDLRERHDMSQAWLAGELLALHGIKLDASAIARIEKNAHGSEGARVIRLGEAMAIASVLRSSMDEMLRPPLDLHGQYVTARETVERATVYMRQAKDAWRNAEKDCYIAEQRLREIKAKLIEEHLMRIDESPEGAWRVDDEGRVRPADMEAGP